MDKKRAKRNRTIDVREEEIAEYRAKLLRVSYDVSFRDIKNRVICQDFFKVMTFLPSGFVDLLIVDPPYNMSKDFNGTKFRRLNLDDYTEWVDRWLSGMIRLLKPTATVYICTDWGSSSSIEEIASKYLVVRNRITWEREKGRGASRNWKNNSEDIWFCTVGDEYTFDVDAVKLKRRVMAPYTHEDGSPKDWKDSRQTRYRLTHPSNLWTDITVPFWSMPENTDHPTQKPEKLIAKLILASSNPGDVVFDPFLGSGTSAVVAEKLGRHYLGIEIDELYCCLAMKRLELAEEDKGIQGYTDGVFWERNTLAQQRKAQQSSDTPVVVSSLFD